MKRTAARILLFLLLGSTTATVVAWGLALRGVVRGDHAWMTPPCAWADPATADVIVYNEDTSVSGTILIKLERSSGDIAPDRIEVRRWGARGDNRYPRVEAPPRPCHPPEAPANCCDEHQFGWPLTCSWSSCDTTQYSEQFEFVRVRGLLRVWPLDNPPGTVSEDDSMFAFSRNRWRHDWYVPTGIMWQPLAIDSGAYGAAWWIVLLAPGIVRRAVRQRRGQCLHCGYSLAGIATGVCPECGKAFEAKGAAA